MTNKPTLTKEQDKVFKEFISSFSNNKTNIERYILQYNNWTSNYIPLRELGFDNFVLALYNGYEVEKDLGDLIMTVLINRVGEYIPVRQGILNNLHQEIMEVIDKWQNLKDGASTNDENLDRIKLK